MKLKLAAIAGLCLLGFAACKKDDTKPGSDNTLTVSVDGKTYTSSASDFVLFIDTLRDRSGEGVYNFAYDLSGPMTGGQQVGMVVNTTNGKLTPGAYTNVADDFNSMYWSEVLNATSYYMTVPQYTTTVNITRCDSAFLEGNFNGKLAYSSDTTKHIELINGQFKINLKTAVIGRNSR